LTELFDVDGLLDDVKRHYVLRAREEADGNKSQAARLLGFSNHQKLGQWIAKLGVDW
jgi:hypothetical protein